VKIKPHWVLMEVSGSSPQASSLVPVEVARLCKASGTSARAVEIFESNGDGPVSPHHQVEFKTRVRVPQMRHPQPTADLSFSSCPFSHFSVHSSSNRLTISMLLLSFFPCRPYFLFSHSLLLCLGKYLITDLLPNSLHHHLKLLLPCGLFLVLSCHDDDLNDDARVHSSTTTKSTRLDANVEASASPCLPQGFPNR
jgi:hypothetical protein